MRNRVNQHHTSSSAFKEAVLQTPDVAGGYNAGIQALKREHRTYIKGSDTEMLEGSVDIDATTKDKYHNDARWDYTIGYGGKAYFVEVHPAETHNVAEVIKKAQWLKCWLEKQAPLLKAIEVRPYLWIPSGRVKILSSSSERRKLAQNNILLTPNLTLPSKCH